MGRRLASIVLCQLLAACAATPEPRPAELDPSNPEAPQARPVAPIEAFAEGPQGLDEPLLPPAAKRRGQGAHEGHDAHDGRDGHEGHGSHDGQDAHGGHGSQGSPEAPEADEGSDAPERHAPPARQREKDRHPENGGREGNAP